MRAYTTRLHYTYRPIFRLLNQVKVTTLKFNSIHSIISQKQAKGLLSAMIPLETTAYGYGYLPSYKA